jgi:hypothetical protein
MSEPVFARKNLAVPLRMLVKSLVMVSFLSACDRAHDTASTPPLAQPAQRSFTSPEEAGAAVLAAAQAADQAALLTIFGPDAKQLLSSGDPVKDQENTRDFVAAYTQMHRWRKIKAGGEMLYIGADNFLFPIPLDEKSAGAWQFDTDAGKDEILARRIGRNELAAIAACTALANAQAQYFNQTHDADSVKQYAQRIVSDEGKQDGLYWPVSTAQAPSPLEDVAEFAKAAGYTSAGSNPQPFKGYYFRILTRQGDKAPGGAKDYIVNGKMTGGFAFLAYPTEYRNSGIMTFIVGPDGAAYQKDLGTNTATAAAAMREFNPGDGWVPAL